MEDLPEMVKISQVLPSLHRLRPVLANASLRSKYCVDTAEEIGRAAARLLNERLTFLMVTSGEQASEPRLPGFLSAGLRAAGTQAWRAVRGRESRMCA